MAISIHLLAVLLAAGGPPAQVTLRDFSCANLWPARLSHPGRWRELNLGMARYDIPWGAVQPQRTKWQFAETDAALLELCNAGVPVLPMLGYTPGWAWVQQDYSFVEAGYRWEIKLGPLDPKRGFRPARCRKVPVGGGKAQESSVGNLPPRSVADWQRYVDRVVARYSRPPYNVRYFQIWNEFNWPDWYHHTWEDFIDRVHIPAAKVIRQHGCKVVFGGWACSAGAEDLCRLLEYHDAWRYTDIIDFHYQPNRAFQIVYDKFVGNGRCEGIWETEIGWCPWKEYLINVYPRVLYWALGHDFDYPDKYKLFWFHFTSVSALHGLTYQDKPDQPLSEHGIALRTLAKMLPGPIKKWDAFSTRPRIGFTLTEEEPSVEGFATRCSRVVVAHLTPAQIKHGTFRVVVRGLGEALRQVDALDRLGHKVPAQVQRTGSDVIVSVKLGGIRPETWRFKAKGATVMVRMLIDQAAGR